MPAEQARSRFYDLQARYGDKIKTNTSESWYSPSKTAELRKKNRATRVARDLIFSVLGRQVPPEDIDWNRQLLWCQKSRLVAPTAAALMAAPDHKLLSKTIVDEYGERSCFHFNLSSIARAASKTESETERLLLA